VIERCEGTKLVATFYAWPVPSKPQVALFDPLLRSSDGRRTRPDHPEPWVRTSSAGAAGTSASTTPALPSGASGPSIWAGPPPAAARFAVCIPISASIRDDSFLPAVDFNKIALGREADAFFSPAPDERSAARTPQAVEATNSRSA